MISKDVFLSFWHEITAAACYTHRPNNQQTLKIQILLVLLFQPPWLRELKLWSVSHIHARLIADADPVRALAHLLLVIKQRRASLHSASLHSWRPC